MHRKRRLIEYWDVPGLSQNLLAAPRCDSVVVAPITQPVSQPGPKGVSLAISLSFNLQEGTQFPTFAARRCISTRSPGTATSTSTFLWVSCVSKGAGQMIDSGRETNGETWNCSIEDSSISPTDIPALHPWFVYGCQTPTYWSSESITWSPLSCNLRSGTTIHLSILTEWRLTFQAKHSGGRCLRGSMAAPSANAVSTRIAKMHLLDEARMSSKCRNQHLPLVVNAWLDCCMVRLISASLEIGVLVVHSESLHPSLICLTVVSHL